MRPKPFWIFSFWLPFVLFGCLARFIQLSEILKHFESDWNLSTLLTRSLHTKRKIRHAKSYLFMTNTSSAAAMLAACTGMFRIHVRRHVFQRRWPFSETKKGMLENLA